MRTLKQQIFDSKREQMGQQFILEVNNANVALCMSVY